MATDGTRLIARCENYNETTDAPCPGTLGFTWGMGVARCDTCGGYSGISVARWVRVEGALLGATDTPADTVQTRLDHLAQLEEGWDSYGAAPIQPGIRDRITTLLDHLRRDPLIGLTPSGGAHLTWGANEDVIIELEPDGTVTALIEGRDLGATDTTPAELVDESDGRVVFVPENGAASMDAAVAIIERLVATLGRAVENDVDPGAEALGALHTAAMWLSGQPWPTVVPATGHMVAPGVPCAGCQTCLVSDCERCVIGETCAEHDPAEDLDTASTVNSELNVAAAEIERLRAIEKRLEETATWCGRDEMHRAITYIRTGEIT